MTLPTVEKGRIERIADFQSDYVSQRHIDVWLPEGYHPGLDHAALYMHDGQMLFDTSTTWNGQSWGAAETVSALIASKTIQPCIVVGIWNADNGRYADYFPKKPFDSLPQAVQGAMVENARADDLTPLLKNGVQSNNYLKFLVEELKPLIDGRYATLPDQQHTFIAGSSMGGLISLYALCEFPEIFGGAACLSTHWIGIDNRPQNPIPNAFFDYLRQSLPEPASHKLYFDYGTETLDAAYEPHQLKVDEIMKNKGYDHSNWQTKKFTGADHTEDSWKKRLPVPLTFLLG